MSTECTASEDYSMYPVPLKLAVIFGQSDHPEAEYTIIMHLIRSSQFGLHAFPIIFIR
jgi:hypothetical protein